MTVSSPPIPSPVAERSAPSWAMPALMSSSVVVVVAMVAAINLALPKLSGSDLQPSSTQLLWIVEAYILVFGGLLIPAGALGDTSAARACWSAASQRSRPAACSLLPHRPSRFCWQDAS